MIPAVVIIIAMGVYLAVPFAVKAGERYPEKRPLRPRLLEHIENEKDEKLAAW
ncbi:MAG: hypothetical protein M1839_009001 [Geoglossum umbratile]|nr:MAG: hypothetical protein M1839_009001 [Geoglossum umbratile]